MLVGGGFYLLNKVGFLGKEIAWALKSPVWYQRCNIAAWALYLAGLIPIVAYFSLQHRWIAASLELGGGPAMGVGLYLALKGRDESPPPIYDVITVIAAGLGIAYSAYELGTLRTMHQLWETVMVVGFLMATMKLYQNKSSGYLWFFVMYLGCGVLSYGDHRYWMVRQQVVSALITVPTLVLKIKYRSVRRAE